MEQGKMKSLDFSRYVLGCYMTAAMLAGCGGSQPPNTIPAAQGIERDSATGSWMLPEAKSEDLLYVTNYSYISVYSYPQDKLVGILNGFRSSVGECVDSKGDIVITNSAKSGRIPEYAHGGTKPIAELTTKHVGPVGCAFDPTTGDLAVSGFGEPPTIDIFKGAQGKPILYKDKDVVETQFCGYDNNGDLFVGGIKNFSSGAPELDELPRGGSKFVEIGLNAAIDGGAGIQWDGEYLAIGAYVPNGSGYTPVIYRFSISGSQGTLVSTITLGSPAYITALQFFIINGTLMIPNWYFVDSEEKKNVLFYKYPQGGSPIGTLTKRVTEPRGVVVSLAQN
jgi:hypothetical protein